MPQRILFGLLAWSAFAAGASADDAIDFARQIQPIFLERCAKCHGEAKAQGKMRLDSAAAIAEKLRAEPKLLVAGKPDESELYQRITLRADSPKRMPKGADPLAQESIALIAEWIKQGAVLPTAAAVVATPTKTEKPIDKPPLPEVAAAPQEAVDRLLAAGARVVPLYAGSNLLDVSFAGRGEPAGDADVALLDDVADQVYSLNLADGKISDAGLAPLATLKNLAWLHLERATAGDDGLASVRGLEQLEYLNLYGTPITDAGLKHLSGLKRLGRLYLWQTKVSYDAAMALEQSIPGLVVNLGYDHPEVARRRLTKELEGAKAAANRSQQAFDQAKKDVEISTARVAEIEAQLQALEKPADGS